MNKCPEILSFPNDDELRVIWWYGPVFKNHSNSNIPLVKIQTRLLLSKNELGEYSFYHVTVSELDCVRLGTIWKGQKRTERIWEGIKGYFSDYEFSFNFFKNEPTSIHYNDKMENTGYWHIPYYVFDIGTYLEKKIDKFHMFNTTLTKLTTQDGKIVLIPSLEFLTSAIAPGHKIIRASLLESNIDSIIDQNAEQIFTDIEGKYSLKLYDGRITSNIVLLAYLGLNPISRARLSYLYTSMTKQRINSTTNEPFEDKYPVVLPFHPEEMLLKGDGIKISENVYLVLRINAISLPEEHSIQLITTKKIHKNGLNQNIYMHPSQSDLQQNDDELLSQVTSENAPHKSNRPVYIKTEVSILKSPHIEEVAIENIESKEEAQAPTKNNEHKSNVGSKIKNNYEGCNHPQFLSSDDANYRNASLNTAQLKQFLAKRIARKPSSLLKITNSLKLLVQDQSSPVAKFLYIREDGIEQDKPYYCKLIKFTDEQNTYSSWGRISMVRKQSLFSARARQCLIALIVLKDGTQAYLLEIERKENESFYGLLFKHDTQSLHIAIKALFQDIVFRKGAYTKRQGGTTKYLPLPLSAHMVYKHSSKVSLENQLLRAIQKGIEKEIFFANKS